MKTGSATEKDASVKNAGKKSAGVPAKDPGRKEDDRLRRSRLIVAGHGSSSVKPAETALFRHAAAISRRKLFAAVDPCFLKTAPRLIDVLGEVPGESVFLVPFLMSDGAATRTVIPGMLGFEGAPGETVQPRFAGADTTLFYCQPVGLHPAIPDVIRSQLSKACGEQGWAAQDVSVLLVAHGTQKDATSGLAARQHAAKLSGSGDYGRVAVAFLEEPPYLADAADLGERPTVVVGLFAESGLHGDHDVAQFLQTARRKGARVAYTGPIGLDPVMADLIVDQARRFGDCVP